MLREKADRLLNDVLDAASLGGPDTSDRSSDADLVDEEAEAPRSPRSTNGGRTRSRAATSASTGSTTG